MIAYLGFLFMKSGMLRRIFVNTLQGKIRLLDSEPRISSTVNLLFLSSPYQRAIDFARSLVIAKVRTLTEHH